MAFGIPPLLNKLTSANNVAALLIADAALLVSLKFKPRWGIYLKGKQVIIPDSVINLDFKSEWKIADYPMEAGAFQSYNKVATPYEIKIRMTKGGSISAMKVFLDKMEMIESSLDLYDVVTPEKTYVNANILNYNYSRTSESGAGIIIVDVMLKEIKATIVKQTKSTKDPSGSDSKSGGTVQTKPATTEEAASLPNLF